MPSLKELEKVHPLTRKEWRSWLKVNHAKSPGIWLVSYRKDTGKPCFSYVELVEEALCFGWIDSTIYKLDDERYMHLVVPRRPRSNWSKVNKGHVERLIANGLMTPAGLSKIEAAKKDGSWSKFDRVEQLAEPAELKKALRANPTAKKNFAAFSPSIKKGLIGWIESAKRPETRAKRIEITVEKASRGLRAMFDKE